MSTQNNQQNIQGSPPAKDRSWEQIIKKYNHPDIRKSIWQICNSVIPYILMWIIMYKSLEYPYWLTLILSFFAAGFLIRIFIIFHDSGHGSFFKSAKTNNITGIIAGIVSFTPYRMWHHHHRIHHATSANLDKRGIGDVWTMTREEYLAAPKKRQLMYRLFRNPWLLFIVGPLYVIFFQNRRTSSFMNKEDRMNVYLTNFMILTGAVILSLIIGIKAFILIQLPIIFISHSIGIWLFLIQHNFEDVEWDRNNDWDYMKSALKGSSFLKLPRMFQWFTGNIGFHHIHHLSPRIPNYNLARCHYENIMFSGVRPITFFMTFRFLRLHLWDEVNQKMIGFREAGVIPERTPIKVNKMIKLPLTQ